MARIHVLRLGHRVSRDPRVSTHVGLVARALGATSLYYTGAKDSSLENSIKKIASNWGGSFKVKHLQKWRPFINNFKGIKIHLTMYGLPIEKNISKIRNDESNKLIIIGGEKVPSEIYDLADYNIAVTSQPHSEIAALAVFLDKYFKGKELSKRFVNAKLRIKPKAKGKEILKK